MTTDSVVQDHARRISYLEQFADEIEGKVADQTEVKLEVAVRSLQEEIRSLREELAQTRLERDQTQQQLTQTIEDVAQVRKSASEARTIADKAQRTASDGVTSAKKAQKSASDLRSDLTRGGVVVQKAQMLKANDDNHWLRFRHVDENNNYRFSVRGNSTWHRVRVDAPLSQIRSSDNKFYLIMQPDGNLVLMRTRDDRAIWASNTHGWY